MKTIGIIGFSGAGKTYFAKHLSSLLDDSVDSSALDNRNLIKCLKKTVYLNVDDMKKQENIKSIFNEIFGNTIKYSDEYYDNLADITKRVEFYKRRIPLVQTEIAKNIEKAKKEGFNYFVLDGVYLPALDLFDELDYTIRILPEKMDKRNYFLRNRLEEDGSPNPQKHIHSNDVLYEEMQYGKVPVQKTIKNRYDRSLLIEAKFISEIIKTDRTFRRLEVLQEKSKQKTECSICNNLLNPVNKHEYVILQTKNFFAKPVMHNFGEGHIMICPKKCISHITKLDDECMKELKDFLNQIKGYLHNQGYSSLLWFHNEPTLNFKNSTPHLHIHIIPKKYILNEKNISEMQLEKIESMEKLSKLDKNKSAFWICDSNNYEFLAVDTYTMPFFRELLANIYGTTFFKFESACKNNQNIDDTIVFYKEFDFNKTYH